MSKIYVTADENGISFTNRPPKKKLSGMILPKEDYLAFLRDLREKEKILVDEEIIRGGFLNPFPIDTYERTAARIRAVKEAASPEEAAASLSRIFGRQYVGSKNTAGALGCEILYMDDLYDLLVGMGMEEGDAESVACSVGTGVYKARCKGSGTRPLCDYSENLHDFALAVKWLPSRRSVAESFGAEWTLFCGGEPTPCAEGAKRLYYGAREALFDVVPLTERKMIVRPFYQNGIAVLRSERGLVGGELPICFCLWAKGGEEYCEVSAVKTDFDPTLRGSFEEYMKEKGLPVADLPIGQDYIWAYLGACETVEEYKLRYREQAV